MSRDWRLYLADIRTACEKVQRFTAGMERTAFFSDDEVKGCIRSGLEGIAP